MFSRLRAIPLQPPIYVEHDALAGANRKAPAPDVIVSAFNGSGIVAASHGRKFEQLQRLDSWDRAESEV
jgi:hypothetical protein